jgi:hypothetical protein
MNKFIISAIILLSGELTLSRCNSEYEPLEMVAYGQLERFDTLNFDLSGIVKHDDTIYVVADKPWNSFLYQIEFDVDKWKILKHRRVTNFERLDLEAIDVCNNIYYLTNEFTGSVYQMRNDTLTTLNIDFESIDQTPANWENAGLEAIAVDCENKRMYLVKERQPRLIFTVDMNSWKVIDQFDIPQTESIDFSDAKFDNGHLYVLERGGNYVTKINPETHEVVDKYHYKKEASFEQGKLYGPTKYGMGEALLITNNEIWIGWDNNGQTVTDHAKSTYGMKKNMPVIFKFKRPKGF